MFSHFVGLALKVLISYSLTDTFSKICDICVDANITRFYNPGQDISNKIEKSSKTGQDKKS